MKTLINRLAEGHSLTIDESQSMFEAFLSGSVSEPEMASILTALKIKGESAEEIAGAAMALKSRTKQTKLEYPVIDTCGTGGDGSGSFNISTAAAFVVAGAGGRVAKHGNRSVTSKSGSADVLEALEVNIELSEEESLDSLAKTGLGFFYAPAIHKSMKSVMPVRRALGFRTIFNLIGPLCNPVSLHGQIIGVGDPKKLNVMADAARLMKLKRTLFVCSEKGMDELTLSGVNNCIFVDVGERADMQIEASKYGLDKQPDEALKGGTAHVNAVIMNSVLRGDPSAHRDAVILNAGAALFVGEFASSFESGVEMAKQALAKGSAMDKLEALRQDTLSKKQDKVRKSTKPDMVAINRMVGL